MALLPSSTTNGINMFMKYLSLFFLLITVPLTGCLNSYEPPKAGPTDLVIRKHTRQPDQAPYRASEEIYNKQGDIIYSRYRFTAFDQDDEAIADFKYQYDANGNLILKTYNYKEIEHGDLLDEYKGEISYIFKSDKLIRKTWKRNGQPYSLQENKFEGLKLIAEEYYYVGNNKPYEIKSEFNEQGVNPGKRIIFDEKGNVKYTIEYMYDAKGNVLTEKENGELMMVYEYYSSGDLFMKTQIDDEDTSFITNYACVTRDECVTRTYFVSSDDKRLSSLGSIRHEGDIAIKNLKQFKISNESYKKNDVM